MLYKISSLVQGFSLYPELSLVEEHIRQFLEKVSAVRGGRGMGARRFLMKGVMGGFLRLQNIVGNIKRMVSGRK